MESLTFLDVSIGLLVALAAGVLVGIEREQTHGAEDSRRIAGIRTFPLIALAGALSALASHATGPWVVASGFVVLGALVALSYYRVATAERDVAMTTAIAALVIYLLGVLTLLPGVPLATTDRYLVVVAGAGGVMALLAAKPILHGAIAKLTRDDLYATVKFVVLVAVVLPLLPDRVYGPFDVLNPFHIGLMVVLVAAISFVGYVAARVLGARRGLAATGLIGGLISSTAVSVSLSRRAREEPSEVDAAAVAIIAASSIMFARILAEVAVVDPPLLAGLGWSMGAMTVVGLTIAIALHLRPRAVQVEHEDVPITNPFELKLALQFGAFYALVLFVSKVAQVYFGESGLYVSSFVAGTTDVDAITLSVSAFHKQGLGMTPAVIAITIAAATNTIVKIGIVAVFGGWRIAARVLLGLGPALLVGAGVLLATDLVR